MANRPVFKSVLAFSTTAFLTAVPATAQETTTYTYDELGRLVETDVAGGPNDTVDTDVTYDDAGNRTNFTVTGSSLPAGELLLIPVTGGKMVVVIH